MKKDIGNELFINSLLSYITRLTGSASTFVVNSKQWQFDHYMLTTIANPTLSCKNTDLTSS